MEFKKFPSLENHYQTKHIEKWFVKFPELEHEPFVITEKIDGANFCIIITKDEIAHQKRSAILNPEAGFFNFQQVMKGCEREVGSVQKLLKVRGYEEIRIYGEIFGEGIQKRVDYGVGKQFLPFEVWVNGEPIPFSDAKILMDSADVRSSWWVPVLDYVQGFDAALAFDLDRDTAVPREEDSDVKSKKIEGVVIVPTLKVFKWNDEQDSSLFRIKFKSPDFGDNPKGDNVPQEPIVWSESGIRMAEAFVGKFSDNRKDDLISKLGPLESTPQLSEYIKAFIDDAKEDFLKDHLEAFKLIDDKEKKRIFKHAGKHASFVLRRHLATVYEK